MNDSQSRPWFRRILWALGLLLLIGISAESRAASSKPTYPLTQLPLLRIVLRLLQQLYIDPTQFSPQNMHHAGLEALEQKLPEVFVQWTTPGQTVMVQVGTQKQTWNVPKFLGLFDVWLRLQPVADFVQKHYQGDVPLAEIEYAMVLGVMSTLDKQTRVISRQILLRRRSLQPPPKTGKIGVVVSYDDKSQGLMIRQVLADGPAALAGLQAGDRILSIDGEIVRGQTLVDWQQKMIGFRGSRVALQIQRVGWPTPRRIVLIRAQMDLPLVESHLLAGQIGYIRLRQFSQAASLWIGEELARLRHQNRGDLLGLILDLRGNPGGLLNEAVNICSMFVEKGHVTTYAGANVQRKSFEVSGKNVEGFYPLVVLLNSHSASASELLAGALQGQQRAVVLGQRSFGKGTVQRASAIPGLGLMYNITIAQYLVHPERSIQMVGVAPDIQLTPIVAHPDRWIYDSGPLRDQAERLKRWPTFLQQNSDTDVRSLHTIRYLWSTPDHGNPASPGTSNPSNVQPSRSSASPGPKHTSPKQRTARRKPTASKERVARSWFQDRNHPLGRDVEVWIARYLLAHTKSGRRDLFLQQIKPALQRLQQIQEQEIVSRFKRLGIDWSKPARHTKATIPLQVQIEPIGTSGPVDTGQEVQLRITLHNPGPSSVYRARAMIHSRLPWLQHREMLWGHIRPKQSVSRTFRITLPHALDSGAEELEFHWRGMGLAPLPPTRYTLRWTSKIRPHYRIAYMLSDPSPDGDGDGQLQAGEKAFLFVTVQATGKAGPTQPQLRLVMEQIGVTPAQISLGTLTTGQSRTAVFVLPIPDQAEIGPRYTRLILTEKNLGVVIEHPLPLQIAPSTAAWMRQQPRWIRCSQTTSMYRNATLLNEPVGHLGEGSRVRLLRRLKQAIQVEIPAPIAITERSALTTTVEIPRTLSVWISDKFCQPTPEQSSQVRGLQWFYQFEPPQVTWSPKHTLVSTRASHTLSFVVDAPHGIRDVAVMQQKKKVAYQLVRYSLSRHKLGTPVPSSVPGPLSQQITRRKFGIPVKLDLGLNRFQLLIRTGQGSFFFPFHLSYLPASKNSR